MGVNQTLLRELYGVTPEITFHLMVHYEGLQEPSTEAASETLESTDPLTIACKENERQRKK